MSQSGRAVEAEPQVVRVLECIGDYAAYRPAIGVPLGGDRWNPVSLAAAALSHIDGTARAFRFANKPNVLTPFGAVYAERFQPTPLIERSGAFWTLVGQRPTWFANQSAQLAKELGVRETSLIPRIVICALLGLLAVFCVYEVYDAVISMIGGRAPELLQAAAGAFLIAMPALALRIWRQYEWFAVPGGIAIRRAGAFSTRWDLRVLTPRDGVMVYWADTKTLAIGCPDGACYSRTATPREADVAFRAWLSPLPPPTVEQLTDLT